MVADWGDAVTLYERTGVLRQRNTRRWMMTMEERIKAAAAIIFSGDFDLDDFGEEAARAVLTAAFPELMTMTRAAYRVGPPAWSPDRGWHGDSTSYVVGECSAEECMALMGYRPTPPPAPTAPEPEASP